MEANRPTHVERERDTSPTREIVVWERRVSDARARLSTEIQTLDDVSPLQQREGHALLEELTLAFEELQVAEEELHVQTDQLTTSHEVLQAERSRYRALFELAPVAYLVTDEHGTIRDANRAAAALLCIPPSRLLGKPLVVFITPSRRRAFRAQLSNFGTSEVEVGLHLRVRPRESRVCSVAASVGIVRGRDGSVSELRWLLVDETARRRRERRVRSMNQMLKARVEERTAEIVRGAQTQQELAEAAEDARRTAEHANRQKTELIAVVSHELRTPLAAIGGYAELLLLGIRGPLTDAQRADVLRIHEAQTHIIRLVDDLVGYSKLETGRLRFDIGEVIVRDSVDAVLSLIRPQATAKNITVTVLTGASSAVARADEERLRQIVVNLLSNAIKFTPANGHVSVDIAADEAFVSIAIHDDGIGIPADKLEAVFRPYVQLESSGARHESGWGLGLAISRDLARAMDGDVSASSSPGEGTTFTLRLPRSTRIAPDTPRD